MPTDNEFSSGWVYGSALVDGFPESVLLRAHLYGGGYFTGMITAELYGVYRTPPPAPVELTYAWREADQMKTHHERIPAGADVHRFHVPTGNTVVDEYVRIRVP